MTAVKKFSFYYRSQAQYLAASSLLEKIQIDIAAAVKQKNYYESVSASLKSPQWSVKPVRDKMPKEKLGKKKYIATITMIERHVPLLPYNVEDKLIEIGVELVSKVPNKPQYTEDELVRTTVFIKSVDHFRKITSILNKKYGHGNWHFRNCKKILQRLRKVEMTLNMRQGLQNNLRFPMSSGQVTDETAKNGLKVDVVVSNTSDNSDSLQKYLFQAVLMT